MDLADRQLDHHHHQQQQQQLTGVTEDCSPTAPAEATNSTFGRKSNKPLMEKRRRERINTCLDQLKAILMDVTKKESSYYSKLEKADILEMTVKYLTSLQRQRVAVRKLDADAVCKYVAGYNECAAQVTQYLTSLPSDGDRSTGNRVEKLADDTRCSLLDHLANSLHQSAAAAATAVSSSHVIPQTTVDQVSSSPPPPGVYVISPQQVPVTSSINAAQLRVLPAKLNSGQLVILLAGSADDHQLGGCLTQSSKLVNLDSCDVIALEAADRPTVPDCVGDEILRERKPEIRLKNSQSESSPAAGAEQQNTDDLHMWRPW